MPKLKIQNEPEIHIVPRGVTVLVPDLSSDAF
jgi:hypothetical protein